MQNDSSDFDGLLHEMVSKEPFINQEISYINKKGDMNCSIVSNYITKHINIIEIDNKFVRYAKSRGHQYN